MNEKDLSLIQVEEAEESFWEREGEDRLETFDRHAAVPHEDAWKEQTEKAE
jgi:hypothetical protein